MISAIFKVGPIRASIRSATGQRRSACDVISFNYAPGKFFSGLTGYRIYRGNDAWIHPDKRNN